MTVICSGYLDITTQRLVFVILYGWKCFASGYVMVAGMLSLPLIYDGGAFGENIDRYWLISMHMFIDSTPPHPFKHIQHLCL